MAPQSRELTAKGLDSPRAGASKIGGLACVRPRVVPKPSPCRPIGIVGSGHCERGVEQPRRRRLDSLDGRDQLGGQEVKGWLP
jgi:hypothetical protein